MPTKYEQLKTEANKYIVGAIQFTALYVLSLRYGTPVMAAFYGKLAGICGCVGIALSEAKKYEAN